MANRQEEENNYQLEARLICRNCGKVQGGQGKYIYHKNGSVSFQITNANNKCWSCNK